MQTNDTVSSSLFLGGTPKKIGKKALVSQIKKILDSAEVSWLTTDARSFEWSEINLDKRKFLNELSSLNFKTAHIGIFHPESKKTEYNVFQIVAA